MNIKSTSCEGIHIIDSFHAIDERGSFVKCLSSTNDIQFEVAETYYSVNKKNVVRGMHFQIPPFDHKKIVHVIKGSVVDVVLDLRKSSSTYGKVFSTVLSEKNKRALYIDKGFAHGFKSLEENTIMLYLVSSVYNKEADRGIHYNSIDFEWGLDIPLISKRDDDFDSFKDVVNLTLFE